MNVALFKESKFLRKEDVADGITVTIRSLSQENVAMAGAEPELKWCLHFDEVDKPLVTNGVNAQMIAKVTGEDDTDQWLGKRIILWNDESVSFGGRVCGGIRVRAVPKASAASAQRQPEATPTSHNIKAALKGRFRKHPEFGKALTADAVNAHLLESFGTKLDDLTDHDAQEVWNRFDDVVLACSDEIPF